MRPIEKVSPTMLTPELFEPDPDPLFILRACDGHYDCPRDKNGKRLGSLMGYAGTYQDEATGKKLQFVGDVYYNFSQAEQLPHVLDWFAWRIQTELNESGFSEFDYLLGAPMGGIALAQSLAGRLDRYFIFAEKKTVAIATAESREKSKLVLNRHVIEPGARIVVVEDVCNNFSTTNDIKELIEGRDANLVGVVCAFNRSGHLQWKGVPVFSPAYIPTKQYRQDDPAVADDTARGNVIWKPKDKWSDILAGLALVEQAAKQTADLPAM